MKPKIKEQILENIFKYLDENKICLILFGSEAIGKATPYSDIDIGIFYTEEVDDEIFLRLQEDLNYYVDTARIIDFVDLSRVNIDFLEFALKGAVIWHVGKEFLKNLTNQKRHSVNLKK
jgi:predicted nucleotidyltransferase